MYPQNATHPPHAADGSDEAIHEAAYSRAKFWHYDRTPNKNWAVPVMVGKREVEVICRDGALTIKR